MFWGSGPPAADCCNAPATVVGMLRALAALGHRHEDFLEAAAAWFLGPGRRQALPAREICTLLWALGCLRRARPELLYHLAACVVAVAEDLDLANLCEAAWALAALPGG